MKTIKLTESDLLRIVKKVIKEQSTKNNNVELFDKKTNKSLGLYTFLRSEPAAGQVYIDVKRVNPSSPDITKISLVSNDYGDLDNTNITADNLQLYTNIKLDDLSNSILVGR